MSSCSNRKKTQCWLACARRRTRMLRDVQLLTSRPHSASLKSPRSPRASSKRLSSAAQTSRPSESSSPQRLSLWMRLRVRLITLKASLIGKTKRSSATQWLSLCIPDSHRRLMDSKTLITGSRRKLLTSRSCKDLESLKNSKSSTERRTRNSKNFKRRLSSLNKRSIIRSRSSLQSSRSGTRILLRRKVQLRKDRMLPPRSSQVALSRMVHAWATRSEQVD